MQCVFFSNTAKQFQKTQVFAKVFAELSALSTILGNHQKTSETFWKVSSNCGAVTKYSGDIR